MENNKRKNGSTYMTAKGVEMRQINLAVRADVADKFDAMCDGLSRSVIFTQLVNEKMASANIKGEEPKAEINYSILTGE
jgi:hypothetical protein